MNENSWAVIPRREIDLWLTEGMRHEAPKTKKARKKKAVRQTREPRAWFRPFYTVYLSVRRMPRFGQVLLALMAVVAIAGIIL